MRRFLNPKNDLTFRHLFGLEKNKGILLAFLNDVFAGVHPKTKDASFQNLNQYPEIRTFAQRIVDLSCHDSEGKQFIIEMESGKVSGHIGALVLPGRPGIPIPRQDIEYPHSRVLPRAIFPHIPRVRQGRQTFEEVEQILAEEDT
jgi:hypothetical protein